MRYVTATIGAAFIFVAAVVVGIVGNAFLPAALQRPANIPLGAFSTRGTPALLAGIAVGALAAIHSFRSTVNRYAKKAEEKADAKRRAA
jgi:hypothetical protein